MIVRGDNGNVRWSMMVAVCLLTTLCSQGLHNFEALGAINSQGLCNQH